MRAFFLEDQTLLLLACFQRNFLRAGTNWQEVADANAYYPRFSKMKQNAKFFDRRIEAENAS